MSGGATADEISIHAMSMAEELAETNRFIFRGKFDRAREAFLPVLERDPANPRLLGLGARLDAETGRISFANAETVVRDLLREHPDDERLLTTAAILAVQQGNQLAAITELRKVAAASTDAYVHQTLAGLLHVSRASWAESWAHYATALRSGPLASPCYRSAAYQVGRTIDPGRARAALQGATAVERAVIRTRAFGPVAMFLVVDAVTLGAMALRVAGVLVAGLAVMSLSTSLVVWCIYANALVCCKKCRNAWVIHATLLWILFAAATSLPWLGVSAAALLIPLLAYRRSGDVTPAP